MNDSKNDDYAANLALYEALVAKNPDVVRKGKTMPYTSRNGHMFSLLDKDGVLSLRLPKAEREAFIEKYGTQLSVQYGRVRQEYVDVPQSLLENTDELQPYFQISYDYVGSLKPK